MAEDVTNDEGQIETQRDKSDENHVIMGGKLISWPYTLSDAGGNIHGTNLDGSTGPLLRGDQLPVIDTSTMESFMGNFPPTVDVDAGGNVSPSSNKNWNDQAGMGMDGMFLPYTTEFVTPGKEGQVTNIPVPSGNLPSFEKPVGIGNISLIDWWNVGSGVITSATLNPFASGHSIEYVVRNSERTDVSTRNTVGGYNKSMRELGQVPNITEQDQSESNEANRPIGLRGPLVVTGWGYDMESHPVPNAKYEADRRNKYTMDGGGDATDLPPQYEKDPTRAHFNFLPNHLQRIDRWKSGPVDLRWDRERKVWVGGRFNGVYLSKAVKCILPKAGRDGKNSFNFGINNIIDAPGRLYRNPCPQTECQYESYFNTSKYYPDIEIYDPEDIEWCGNCKVVPIGTAGKFAVECTPFTTTCVPFYDAIIIRSVDHTVAGRNTYSSCGDKFSKTIGGAPQQRRMGDPCHRWGGSALATDPSNIFPQPLHAIMPPVASAANAKYSESAKKILYQKILIENPLNQGLMLGDSFLSYDTGRRVAISYKRNEKPGGCGVTSGSPMSVQEILPVHVILQAEFFSAEIMSYAGCGQGEFSGCTRKLFFQGMSTLEDCGPDDDYPQTAIV
jgi:hypothetical protein